MLFRSFRLSIKDIRNINDIVQLDSIANHKLKSYFIIRRKDSNTNNETTVIYQEILDQDN